MDATPHNEHAPQDSNRDREILSRSPKRPMSRLQAATQRINDWSASSWGTGSAALVIAVWIAAGSFSRSAWDVGERFIGAVSFLLLFLLQRSQKKDTQSIQLKLNELLAALDRASPKLINIEDESEEEVGELHQRFQDIQQRGSGAHSIEDACPSDADEQQEQQTRRKNA